jgi:hypothetical protein
MPYGTSAAMLPSKLGQLLHTAEYFGKIGLGKSVEACRQMPLLHSTNL